MKVLCLLFVIGCAFSLRDPLENNRDYKRFQDLYTRSGKERVDLLAAPITARATVNDVTYFIYSKTNLDFPHPIRSDGRSISPHFEPSRDTIFIIHGWVDDHTADVNRLVKTAVLNKRDVNVVVVDWSPIASQSYSTAQGSVTIIGTIVGNFINELIDQYNLSGNQLTLIGHSLGAHIAGNAGKVIKNKVSHIIGLDPAAPAFTVDNTDNRLDPSDAQYVQIIHTNGRFLGFSSSIGHSDFYPNGGMVQAGCGLDLLGGCSHARAFQYLSEAIDGAKYTATQCTNYNDFKKNKCSKNKKALLGVLDVDRSVTGDYFLETNAAAPFAKE